jgi:pyruvate/2-oxoacid:ferredoxin oxidoreductase beta subunit
MKRLVEDALKQNGYSFIKARRHCIKVRGESEWYSSWPEMSAYWEYFAKERLNG